jgi:GAF domain-containing protein
VTRLSALLASEREPARGLEHLLAACRRLTRAEAGTVYLRRGESLEFAVVQNDVLAARLGAGEMLRRLAERPLSLREPSIASYVVLTGVNLRDAYEIPADQSCTHFQALDRQVDYRTRSMLATPLRDAQGRVFGVLQLINALAGKGRVGAFSKDHQTVVQTLAALAAHVPAAAATS